MTLAQLAQLDRPFATADDVGRIIGIAPDALRVQARKDPARLGFPVCVAGNTVRIPREAFIAWMRGTPVNADQTPQDEPDEPIWHSANEPPPESGNYFVRFEGCAPGQFPYGLADYVKNTNTWYSRCGSDIREWKEASA